MPTDARRLTNRPAPGREALPHGGPGTAKAVRVCVCIATYRRPLQLRELLESLGRLRFPRHTAGVAVIVVDNDTGRTGRAPVEAVRRSLPFTVEYLLEPERNISRARNRGVARALERGAEFIAFVDDDEVVDPLWLDELLHAQARFAADAVQGATLPRYGPGTPEWVRAGRFFAPPAHEAGAGLPVAPTRNVLIAAALLGAPEPFDPAFGLSGGEDSMFFLRASRDGARIVAAPGAVTREHVPLERARPGWLLRRAFREGNTALLAERGLAPAKRASGTRLALATARMAASAALLPFSVLRGRAGVMRSLRGVSYGLGCWAALAGYRYFEYLDPGR